MSITEVKNRPGWYDVVVYDRVKVPGKRPEKISRRVKGIRAAGEVERDLKNERESGSLTARRGSLSAYAASYLKSRRAEVSRQTHAGYAAIVARYIDPHPIGEMRIGEVDVLAVRSFYADVLESGSVGEPLSPGTVSGVHRVLSMILRHAVDDGLLRVNPCERAKPPKDNRDDEDEREAGVDPAIAQEFVAATVATPIGAIAALAFGTGLRRSELLGLRWRDVDLGAGELRVTGKIEQVKGSVQRTTPKTKHSRRTVPFGANTAAVLRGQKLRIKRAKDAAAKAAEAAAAGGADPGKMPVLWVDEGWVFPSLNVSWNPGGVVLPAGRIWTPNAFAQEWRQERDRVNEHRLGEYVLAKGKVEDFEPWEFGIHALRHAFGTQQLYLGVRLENVSRRMGHSSSAVTLRVYSHVLVSEERDGVDEHDRLIATPATTHGV